MVNVPFVKTAAMAFAKYSNSHVHAILSQIQDSDG